MRRWARFSEGVARFTGSGKALVSLLGLVAAWLVWGVVGGWTRAWEVTMFSTAPVLSLVLLIFLQHSQNRGEAATHVKLNELLLTLEEPSNDVVAAERKPDHELRQLADSYEEAVGGQS